MSVLAVRDLHVELRARHARVHAVRGVSFAVAAGETLAIVGESGCGKSLSMLALAGLLPPTIATVRGSVRFDGQELIGCSERALNRLRGDRIGMVFQDPMSALNPTMRIGDQVAEVLVAHRGLGWAAARRAAVDLLARLRVPDAAQRARQYPCEFSGGMLQRALIATAIACRPALLIADEPTTALDATVQNEVLDLLQEIQREDGMGLLLITHDLGVVARLADRVAVMYAGRIVEANTAAGLFAHPRHPYTRALLAALPRRDAHGRRLPLQAIPGLPPDLATAAPGCAFTPRCAEARGICARREPPSVATGDGAQAACWLMDARAGGGDVVAPSGAPTAEAGVGCGT